MPPSMRSAAKAAKEAVKASQEPIPDDNSDLGHNNNTEATGSTENQVPKTPSKTSKPVPAPVAKSSAKKRKTMDAANWPWTHHRPTQEEVAENTRSSGRNLIPWQRARMAEKFLLMTEYECSRQGVAIPWDDIAHRFHPGATAAGVQQHFARLRSILAAEGHLIPPKLPTRKDRAPIDSTIRGFIRQGIEDGRIVTRPVKFTEPLEHPTHNRADAHDIRAYEDNDNDTQPRKARKLDTADGGQLGSASKSTKTRRRTRVPITYLDAAESDSDDTQEADYEDDEDAVPAGNAAPPGDAPPGDAPSGDAPLVEFPIRDDVHVEELAMNLYTRNLNPRVVGNDPQPMYFVHGELMSFTQVCARAVELYNYTGFQDPECGRIIAQHARTGGPMSLGHFPMNNFTHPIREYPGLYRPERGVPAVMPSFANQQGQGLNIGTAGYEQSGPITPPGHAQADRSRLYGHADIATGSMGPGPASKPKFTSPGAYNPGGRLSNPNDYKTPSKSKSCVDFTTPTKDKSIFDKFATRNTDVPIDPFHGFNPAREFGTLGLHAGTANDQGFDIAAYTRHLADSQNHIGNSSMSANNAGRASDEFSPFKLSDSGNVGSLAGPSSSTSTYETASPQESGMTGPSPSEASLSPAHAAGDKDDEFVDYPSDSEGSTSGK